MVEDVGTANSFPILNVSRKIHSNVLEYCKYHVEARNSALTDDEMKTWDEEFVKVDQAILFELIQVLSQT